MKKNINKIVGLCLFLMLATLTSIKAQKGGGAIVTINGPISSSVGTTETYTITTSAGLTITAANWTVIGGGGTVQIQTNTSATINWTTAGTHTIKYVVTASNQGALIDNHIVTITTSLGPAEPQTPYVANITCTSAELIATGTVPSGHAWYWQGTNSSGTSTANPSTNNYIANSNGTYYIKAYEASSNQWSLATFVTVTLSTPIWYPDTDGDGLGDPNTTLSQCTQPNNYVSNSDDQCPTQNGEGSSTGCVVPVSLSNENYVYTIAPQVASTNLTQLTLNSDAIKNVTYLDGLGRPIQNIEIKQSASQKDIVSYFIYDSLGRQTKQHLPYASSTNSGAIKTGVETEIHNYYKTNYADDFTGISVNNINPYSEKELEASPLNRVQKETSPGEDWKLGNGHEIEFDYKSNDVSEVRLYRVSLSSSYVPTLIGGTSYYTTGELTKVITRDENHTSGTDRTTEKFTNLQGKVVLKRTYNNGQKYDTYFVYNDFGNLSYVLPPKVEANINIPNSTELNELCYQYKYDHRNRLVEKKTPGKGWEYIIYDNLDRPVMIQDANLKLINKWLYTKYDKLGRVIYTGLYLNTSATTRLAMQNTFDSNNNLTTELYENKASSLGSLGIHYYNNNFPKYNIEPLTVNYYDNYTFDRAGTPLPSGISYTYLGTITDRTQGLPTGGKVKVLGTSDWITTVTYYDQKARPIYVYSKNDYLNTTDVMQSRLDFAGKIEETISTHTKIDNTQATINTVEMFTYDHVGRLLTQTQQINNDPIEVIMSNTYDELGQLESKRVGGSLVDNDGLQNVDYKYNVRGWLTNINDVDNIGSDLFTFKLNYNQTDISGSVALFNGNISETIWNTANDELNHPGIYSRGYSYNYDALNRIEEANFRVESSTGIFGALNNGNYDLKNISYDENGNILTLKRTGNYYNTEIDALVYTYDIGNKLLKVVDNGTQYSNIKDQGFKDGTNTGNDYSYDGNGNMIQDWNKNINSITYNHLNLPTYVQVAYGNTGNIQYVYDATGVKQRKIVYTWSGGTTTTTDYAGNYIYENDNLQFFNHSEGYVKYENNAFDYVYQYKDNLGNVRLTYTDVDGDGTITAASEIVEESNYYPFGLKHKGYNFVTSPNGNSTAQKFKYNGIEFENALSIDWYEMDMRQYDPAIARWTAVDPVTHFSNSTYNAFDNNPVFFADPSGADAIVAGNWSGAAAQNMYSMIVSNFGGSTNNGDCNDCNKEGQTREFTEWHGNSSGTVTKYYHVGVNGSKSGWYSKSGYRRVINKSIEKISWELKFSEGSIAWLNSIEDDDLFLGIMSKIASLREPIKRNSIPGTITPMGFDSPFFVPGLAAKLIRGKTFAFWSGNGTQLSATGAGFRVIGGTRAGQNMLALTNGMNKAQVRAAWDRLSAALANSYKSGSTAHVYLSRSFMNNKEAFAKSTWKRIEEPILKANGVNIIKHYVK